MAGVSLASQAAAAPVSRDDVQRVIFLFLCGGPSQLDTWDPKPEAPAGIRGPFSAIRTNVPGMELSELFPQMAQRADKFSLIRSMYHRESPIHETGHQLVNSGYLFRRGVQHPSLGSVAARHVPGTAAGIPPYAVLPGPLGNTGVNVSHGQNAGFLGREFEPCYLNADEVTGDAERARYGDSAFGRNCLAARLLLERGVTFVTVNMFTTVFAELTWDCHANSGDLATTLDDYQRTVCPMFDRAYSALLDDLEDRGLLENTLVVATGEFGRTPKLNSRGGRDHWPGVWTALVAGGSAPAGQVIGGSDSRAAEPKDRPVHPSELAASIHRHLGVDTASRLPGPKGEPVAVAQAEPLAELNA